MKRLSDKYIAGFLDSDGCIYFSNRKLLVIEFTQKQSNDGVLSLIHEITGGSLLTRIRHMRGTQTICTRLVLTGKRAVSYLNRWKQHLVVKREIAEECLLKAGQPPSKIKQKNFPSRAWLAGYFDGDGMVYAGLIKIGSASIRVSITTHTEQQAGVRLVQKNFGGSIRTEGNKTVWEKTLDASGCKKFFGYFQKHSIKKRDQILFTLGCAGMGHFRDGKVIYDTLIEMKTRPHRVNDLPASIDVSKDLAKVQDLPRKRGQHCIDKQTCVLCGSEKLYALDMCNPCWQFARYQQKRHSK